MKFCDKWLRDLNRFHESSPGYFPAKNKYYYWTKEVYNFPISNDLFSCTELCFDMFLWLDESRWSFSDFKQFGSFKDLFE